MPYSIRLPDGRLVKNIPDDMPPEEAKKRIIDAGLVTAPKPEETTLAGQAKEFVKGLIPGAVGLVEQAAVGASAILPEDYETAAREKIAQVAGAAKEPFAAAPGYEQAVGRKLGEAVGSTGPFLLAGPAGLVGRALLTGTAVAAGAGEARTRAEKEGATKEQRTAATAFGTVPGALEVFAPFRILSRIPEKEVLTGVQIAKRAALAGGEEAAQEAVSNWTQNLIAKGVYKPEQELIEGLGESAAYGGATGAIIQGVMDLALGRRARGAAAPETTEDPIDKLRREAAQRLEEQKAARQPGIDVGALIESTRAKPISEAFPELTSAIEGLKAAKPSSEIKAAIKALEAERSARNLADVEKIIKGKKAAEQFLTAEEAAAAEVTPREEVDVERLSAIQRLKEQQTGLLVKGKPPAKKSPARATYDALGSQIAELEAVAPPAPPAPTEAVPEPTVRRAEGFPEVLDAKAINKIGFTRGKTFDALLGKNASDPEVRAVLEDYKQGEISSKTAAKIDAFLAQVPPRPAAVAPAAPTETLEPTTPYGATEGLETAETKAEDVGEALTAASGVGPSVAGEPGAGAPTGGVGVVEPSGVVPPVEDAGEPLGREGQQPAAIAAAPAETPAPAATVEDLKAQQQALLTKAGKVPAKKSPARQKYDALQAQIDALEPPPARSEYEFPVNEGLSPAQERQLREKLDQHRRELRALEAVRDKAAGDLYLAEITGNEEAKVRATDAYESVRLTIKKAVSAANRTYARLFDLDKADFQGDVGEAYIADFIDEQRAKKRAGASREGQGLYPYNLMTVEAVHDELRDQASHLPGYKELIEKYFSADRKLKKNADPNEFIAEGQKFLDKSVLYQQTRTGAVDLQNSKEMDDALRGKSFEEAIDYAIKNARDDLDRAILVKAKRRAAELAAKGVEFSFNLTGKGRVLRGYLGIAETIPAGLGEATTINVKINGYTGDPKDTLNQETLAHEIVHAVTTAQIKFAPQGTAAIKLRNLQQELVAIYNDRFKANTLTKTEKGVVFNALKNSEELLAYGLTSGEVQNWLASIPDPSGGTYLSRLFDIISQVLGLKGKETSALARLMSISEEILDESLAPHVAEANRQGLSFGKQANLTGIPSWALQSAQGLKTVWHKGDVALFEAKSVSGKTIYVAAKKGAGRTSVDVRNYTGSAFTPAELTELRQTADNLTTQVSPMAAVNKPPALVGKQEDLDQRGYLDAELGENKVIGARVQTLDSLAGVSAKFAPLFGGKVRSLKGELNPEVLLSRALDWIRFSGAAQREGMLVADKDGLAVATDLTVDDTNFTKEELDRLNLIAGQKVSYLNTLKFATNSKVGKQKIDELLAAEREYQLYQNKEDLEALKNSGKELKFFYTEEEATALHDEFMQTPEAQVVGQMLDAVRFKGIDFLVDTGRWDAEKAAQMKGALGYMPFHRISALDASFNTRTGRSGASAFRNMYQYTGSEEKQIKSPIEAFSGLMDWITREGMLNAAASKSLETLELINAAKRVGGKETVDRSQQKDVVRMFKDGKVRYYQVHDPALLPAFAISPRSVDGWVRGAQSVSRVLRAGVTSMPPFVFKQIADDITRVFAFGNVDNPVKVMGNMLLNFPTNWFRLAFDKKSASMRDLEKRGLAGVYDFSDEGNVKHLMQEGGVMKPSVLEKMYRIMEAGARASDISVRQALYDQKLKETNDPAQAEAAAREIINFSRRGASNTIDTLIRIVPFFNAFARGFDKLLVSAAGGKTVGTTIGESRATFWRRMTYLTAMGVTYALLMSDDEEYNNLSDHVRDRNIILPFSKEFVKEYGVVPAIPLPADLAFIFKAIPERFVQYIKKYGTDEEQDALKVVAEMVRQGFDVFGSPNLIPQIARPIIENMGNYSFFLDRPLESQAQQRLLPYKREGMATSDTMKALASGLQDFSTWTGIQEFAVSPIKLENFVRGMLGSIAGPLLAVGDAFINPSRTDRPLHQMLGMQLTGASAFVKDALSSKSMDELYKLEKRSAQAYNTFNELAKSGDMDKAQAAFEDNYGYISVYKDVSALLREVAELSKAAREIDKDASMTPDERRQAINQLRVLQNEYAQDVFRLQKMARDLQREAQ